MTWQLASPKNDGGLFLITPIKENGKKAILADVVRIHREHPDRAEVHKSVSIGQGRLVSVLRFHFGKRPVLARLEQKSIRIGGSKWSLEDASEEDIAAAREYIANGTVRGRIEQMLGIELPTPRSDQEAQRRRNQRSAQKKSWNREFKKASASIRAPHQMSAKEARAEERKAAERARITAMMQGAPGASSIHRGVKSIHVIASGAVKREPDTPKERVTDGKRHPVTTRKAGE